MDRTLSLITPTGRLTLGNLLGALRGMAAAQDSGDCFYGVSDLHAMTTPHDPTVLREAIAEVSTLLLAAGLDPATGHPVPAEPGAGTPRAGLPAGVHGVHRRAEPDDPVQGEGARRRVDPGLALHLPGPDGGRHPALPAVVGAGRRRPAPARRAHPRPRDPLQQHLRPGVHRAGGDAAAGRGAGDGPAVADVEDVEVGPRGHRRDPAARPARRRPPEGGAGRDRLRHRAGRGACRTRRQARA